MWITKLLVLKLDKYDKKIDEKMYEGTISEKDALKKAVLIGCLEGIVDGCLIVGVVQVVTVVAGTIRLITKK